MKATQTVYNGKKESFIKAFATNIRNNYELYIISIPTLVYIIIFQYGPLYGLQLAFKDFIAVKGIGGSPWIGWDNFSRFFSSYQFLDLIQNTVGISIYQLAVGFPCPIILALLINELGNKRFKKTVQMVTYAPHFISVVVLVGMINVFLAKESGVVNIFLAAAGLPKIGFLTDPDLFKSIYVFSGIWQHAGWGTIIYLAVLSGIDPQMHEAATVDGATKLQRILYINIPGILPTAVVLLILDAGRMMSVGFEKVFLMQNALNLSSSEIISTYVYKMGLLNAEFSFSTAVGLFNSIINMALLVCVNRIAKHYGESSLW